MKFNIKDLIVYQFNDDSNISNITNELLQDAAFIECGPTDSVKTGFISPFSNGDLLLTVKEHALITVQTESKILPAAVVNRELAKKVKEVEEQTQQKVKKTQRLALKDELMMDLLPRAFTNISQTYIWINYRDKFIGVATSSYKKAEDCLSVLRKLLGTLKITPLATDNPVEHEFTNWIKEDKAPKYFTILNTAVLVDPLDNGTIKAINEDLTSSNLHSYIDDGRTVTLLTMSYKERTTFTINKNLILSNIKYSDELCEHVEYEDQDQVFEATFLLIAEELSELFKELMPNFK
ncbi:recombination-associated protein RdgC [Orbus mooreae]|uniref:recombination-associated protein RdgC n=1 Tax=Orbus mooreae TaxID=3074107 RepID=UPI00370D80F5